MVTLLADASSSSTNFFTGSSLGTFASASLAVVVVSNTFRRVFRRDWVVVPFIISIAVAYAAAATVRFSFANPLDVLLVLLNGCLLFCTAFGLNTVLVDTVQAAKNPREIGGERAHRRDPVPWLSIWGHKRPFNRIDSGSDRQAA